MALTPSEKRSFSLIVRGLRTDDRWSWWKMRSPSLRALWFRTQVCRFVGTPWRLLLVVTTACAALVHRCVLMTVAAAVLAWASLPRPRSRRQRVLERRIEGRAPARPR